MAEFKPISSQEEYDQSLKDRLRRERHKREADLEMKRELLSMTLSVISTLDEYARKIDNDIKASRIQEGK